MQLSQFINPVLNAYDFFGSCCLKAISFYDHSNFQINKVGTVKSVKLFYI
jgi:hypothetical protein